MERKEILNEVANYIRYKRNIKTNKELAMALRVSATSLASALNGDSRYLNDTFMMRIVALFPEFNPTYLLRGEGSMLVEDADKAAPEKDDSLAERYLKVIESQQEMLKAQQESITKLVNKVTDDAATPKRGSEQVS